MKANLSLNKETIAKLNTSEMEQMKGGTEYTNDGNSCPIYLTCVTVCIDTCAYTCGCSGSICC